MVSSLNITTDVPEFNPSTHSLNISVNAYWIQQDSGKVFGYIRFLDTDQTTELYEGDEGATVLSNVQSYTRLVNGSYVLYYQLYDTDDVAFEPPEEWDVYASSITRLPVPAYFKLGSTIYAKDTKTSYTITNSDLYEVYTKLSSAGLDSNENLAIGNSESLSSFYAGGGSGNIAMGSGTLGSLMAASNNIALGTNALFQNDYSSGNVAIGSDSLNKTTGENNTGIGVSAGSLSTTGSNNTFIGYNSSGATEDASNAITLGNSAISVLRCQVTSITSLSDRRDKMDITPLKAGLDFLNKLSPVAFTWNMRNGSKVGEKDTGFIAQDIQQAMNETGITIPGLVYDINPDAIEISQGKLIPVLVQAIKELKAEVDALKAKVN